MWAGKITDQFDLWFKPQSDRDRANVLAAMLRGPDLRLSSLKRYVEAFGGKVRLHIELPDGSHYQFHL